MKKFFAILLALVMTLSLSAGVFAEGEPEGLTITVENPVLEETYSLYKVFDATFAGNAVSYTTQNTQLIELNGTEGFPFELTETTTEGTYNVAVKEGFTDENVITWLQANVDKLGAAIQSIKPTVESPDVVFTGLAQGYYLIVSNVENAVVTVTNASGDVTVHQKNSLPSVDKWVKNDAGEWVRANTAGIGDTVHFKIKAHVPLYDKDKKVIQYTFTDTLGKGLSFADPLNLTATLYPTAEETEADAKTVTVTATPDPTNEQVMTITLPTDIEGYYPDAYVVFTYDAVVNEDAEFVNTNDLEMTWTCENAAPPTPIPDKPHTDTYVFGFDVVKYYKDSEGIHHDLTGAEFKLYDAETEGNEIKVTLVKTEDGVNYYRVLTAAEITAGTPAASNIKAGKAQIFGLAPGTYWLEEVKAPDGYNLLAGRVGVTIKANGEDGVAIPGGIVAHSEVENKTGSELPETGGIGTTIFYVIGGLLMVGAAVLLIVRKKMSVED